MGLHMGLGYACCDYGPAYLQIDLSLSQLLQQRPCSCTGTSRTVSPIAASQLVGLLICTICMCAASSGGHLSMSRSLMLLKAVAEVLAGGVQQPVMSPETSEFGTKVLSQQAHLSWQVCVCACLPESADAAVWQDDVLLYFDQTALQWRLSEGCCWHLFVLLEGTPVFGS